MKFKKLFRKIAKFINWTLVVAGIFLLVFKLYVYFTDNYHKQEEYNETEEIHNKQHKDEYEHVHPRTH